MKWNRTNFIIGASSLALIGLFAFQVKWMSESKKLIEEQFNQKVSLAMCYAVDVIGSKVCSKDCAIVCKTTTEMACGSVQEDGDGYTIETKNEISLSKIEEALSLALNFYDVNLDFHVAVNEQHNFSTGLLPTHSCKLSPMHKDESQILTVSFPGKEKYIFGKMRFMFFASVIILAFITLVFFLANYYLLRQKRMQGINKEFFNNMAHEFKTPLTNISLANNMLAKNNEDVKSGRYIKVVKEESKKLSQQVDRILQLAKMENGHYQLEKESLCLKSLIGQVIKDMDIQIKAKNAKINFVIENESMDFEGDKFHMGNVFRNLLENALKYSGENPEIGINLKKDEKGVLIHFQDNGIGIKKQDQKDVFEKYFRVNNGNIHDQKGFGLGLAYVKMIIERHKGVIKIFSDLNKGTRFDLFLPAK